MFWSQIVRNNVAVVDKGRAEDGGTLTCKVVGGHCGKEGALDECANGGKYPHAHCQCDAKLFPCLHLQLEDDGPWQEGQSQI